MAKLAFFFCLVMILRSSCGTGKSNYSLVITHSEDETMSEFNYVLTDKSLRVITKLALDRWKQKLVYERTIGKPQSKEIYQFLTSLRLDTLKSSGRDFNALHSQFVKVVFTNKNGETDSALLQNARRPVTDVLVKYIDSLILLRRYRYSSWGKSE